MGVVFQQRVLLFVIAVSMNTLERPHTDNTACHLSTSCSSVCDQMIDSTAIPPLIRLTTYLSHKAPSTSASLTAIEFSEDLSQGLQGYWTNTFTPGLAASGVAITGRHYVEYIPTSSLSE